MNKIRGRVHFVGIGGSGMSGLAQIMVAKGYQVSGSDMKESETTIRLRQQGATVHIGHAAEYVKGAELLVVSTAIKEDNPELLQAKSEGITIWHRSDILAWLMENQKGICIAGAHGKTTTTSIISLVLENNNLDPTIVIGGGLAQIQGNAKQGNGEYLVAEADESDGSFLKLHPYFAVITNIEDDHLDHYGTVENIIRAFEQFVARIPETGVAILCYDDPQVKALAKHCRSGIISYGLSAGADYRLDEIGTTGTQSRGKIYYRDQYLGEMVLNVPGDHNQLNALAAVAVGRHLGLAFEDIVSALQSFRGAQRRFQILGEVDGITVVDDYAHHPTELKATLKAARDTSAQRVVALFQPHRYTRTRQLHQEFGRAFSNADVIAVTEIYSAGEAPIPNVDGGLIVTAIEENEKRPVTYLPSLGEALTYLKELVQPGDLVLTLGAGNVFTVGEQLVEFLKSR
ncbi:MAG TPA: UDP-N-acetylmuramate--L-alanine ligase [Bacillota bacterium]|nr:UDP-N-acetylmuramate--L-alanine ligase [Bacillota bacterium]